MDRGPAPGRDPGFRDGAAYLFAKGRRGDTPAVALAVVDEGGVMGRAGLRAGDVLPDLSHSGLFRRLHRHRGREVERVVVDGGAGPQRLEAEEAAGQG